MTPTGYLGEGEPAKSSPRNPVGSLIKLPTAEQSRLLNHVSSAYMDGWQDNEQRIGKFRRYYKSWRTKIGMAGGLAGKPNYRVPLIVEKVLIKWAKTLDSLLGEDAQIVAQPTGPVDQAIMHKVSRYMTWQVFNHMDIVEELAKFIFQEIIFGRAHAELYYDVKWLYGPGDKKQLLYDGPCFKTLPVDCFVVPPSAGESTPQEFAWACTRSWMTLDELLVAEAEGYVTGIADNAKAIAAHAAVGRMYDATQDQVREQQAQFEGVVSDYAASDRKRLEVRKHYGRWRMLKGKSDAEYDDYSKRDLRETEVVVTYIPDLTVDQPGSSGGLLLGVQDLAELYPNTANRRPIVSASLLKDGSYWSPGLPEMLEDTEFEMSVNHNLMNKAGELMVSPPGFYIPGMGMSEERQKLEPGMLYASADPSSVNFAKFEGDYQFCVIRNQMLTAIAEGVSGLSAASVGRQSDLPNSPRTFRGQALLQGNSDIRNRLELIFMTEDWSKILDHIKMLVDEYGPEQEEFRVTEEAASGYFETNKGFASISAQERQGKYDFKLKFATSAQSREANKERILQFMQGAAPWPIVMQDGNLQRDWLKVFARELQMEGLLPALNAVPDMNVPVSPQVEWTQALQGIDPRIHPQDDDDAHLADHHERVSQQLQLPEEQRDKDAVFRMTAHMLEHEDQKRRKMVEMMKAQAMANVQGVLGMMGQAGGNGANGAKSAGGAGAMMGVPGSSGPSVGQQMAGFEGDMSPAEMSQ